MKILIKTKNLETTPSIEAYVEEKFGGLKRFINILDKEEDSVKTLAEVFVELGKEANHHRKGEVFLAEARIALPGKNLIAKATSDDLFKAIVKAKDEMKLEIEKYKFKKIDKNRRQQRKSKKDIAI